MANVTWGSRTNDQIIKYTEYCNNRFKLIEFPCEFSSCSYNICNKHEHKNILDLLYLNIIKILSDAATYSKSNDRSSKFRKARVIGWNNHVRDAHREARLKFQNWVWHNKPKSGNLYNEMCLTRKIFKSKLKWCQNHEDQIRMDIIAEHRASKNFSEFWKATSKLNVEPGLPVSIDGVSGSGRIADLFKEHFKVGSSLGPSRGVIDAEPVLTGELYHVSAKQVRTIISNMVRGKSPGHDGLSIEHLKFAGVHLPRVLSMFFNLCFIHSHLPQDLMRTIVVPIIKNKTGDLSNKCNYRPISLATVVAKVLDSVLDSELDKHLNIHDAQFGFRQRLSTETAILSLKHTVQYYTQRRTPVYACFLDLSKAFDLVSYDKLWNKLAGTGVHTQVQRLFQYWYTNQVNNVRWAGSLSGAYRLECGVRQGGLSSPKLFNLYVNELIDRLSRERVGCSVDNVFINNISYADDMVLLCPSVSALRRLLGICEEYAGENGLVYNSKKSEYMVFKAAGKVPESVPVIRLNGSDLNRVNSFKYLGHYITDDLDDQADIERERRALAIRSNMLARRFARCSRQVKITLFKAYCQSFYTSSLWFNYTKKSLNALRVQYNNGFRMLMGLPRFCSASTMFAEARVDGFHAIMRKKTASLLSRLRSSANSILQVIPDRYDLPIMKSFIRVLIK